MSEWKNRVALPARHVHVLRPQLPIVRSGSGASFCGRRPYARFPRPLEAKPGDRWALLDHLVLSPLVGAEESAVWMMARCGSISTAA
jgi:hypothetical protein